MQAHVPTRAGRTNGSPGAARWQVVEVLRLRRLHSNAAARRDFLVLTQWCILSGSRTRSSPPTRLGAGWPTADGHPTSRTRFGPILLFPSSRAAGQPRRLGSLPHTSRASRRPLLPSTAPLAAARAARGNVVVVAGACTVAVSPCIHGAFFFSK